MSGASNYLSKMSELMIYHQIISVPEELTDANLKELVSEFQEKAGLFVDGIPGRDTLWALQYPVVMQAPKQSFVPCDADVAPGHEEGLAQTVLRADVAERYRLLRTEVRGLGGVVTSDGGKRALDADVNSNRSPTSMHYTGLAFDLYTNSGFFKPDVDPFVITRGEETYWVVWCRAAQGQARQLNAVYWKNEADGVDRVKTVSGTFVNFTDVCGKYGFSPIGPRTPFTRPANRQYLSAEWWHFQCNELLIASLSQFGIELLKLEGYTPEAIAAKNSNIWDHRKVIYRKNWF
jgi:hypothetical protein